MITERKRWKLEQPVTLILHDILVCKVADHDRKIVHEFRDLIKKPVVVDTVATFDIKDEFGFADGIGGIFGKAQ